MVYTASSIALAVLEILVHARFEKVLVGRYNLFAVHISVDLILESAPPKEVQRLANTQSIGDAWANARSHPVLSVPSILTGEPNYLLNPEHKDFGQLTIGEPKLFTFDQRFFPASH
jgi:RES domain-containing protein